MSPLDVWMWLWTPRFPLWTLVPAALFLWAAIETALLIKNRLMHARLNRGNPTMEEFVRRAELEGYVVQEARPIRKDTREGLELTFVRKP